MSWDVENTDEFASWFVDLSEADQDAIRFADDLYDVHLMELKQEGLLK
jgi:hypothetical protein